MQPKKKPRFSKKGVITIFILVAVLMMTIIVVHHNPFADPQEELVKKVISCGLIVASCLIFVRFYEKFTTLPMELWQSRHLIWKLSKNDFKKRYAGSYLGAVWAMAQPVVTVLMYFLVFDRIFGSKGPELRAGVEVPFVLFLTAGLVPWFYFSEALNHGTMALIEYTYLVKKVVFKISIIPIIKVIGATFIHAFFVGVLVIVAMCYGYFPTLYTLQIFYYSFCMFILVLALCYSTCAIMVFFKDLAQIINIALQIGMWATPILWNMDDLVNKYGDVVNLLKINPLVYIVQGYRDAIYGQRWFFEDFYSTMYFWIITVVLFGIGALIFKRLKVHFADVL